MATDTAAPPPARASHAPHDPTTHLWQVPVFLLGVAVFVCAWRGWLPLGTPDAVGDFSRDLAALRLSYEKVTPDRDELKELLARVATNVDSFPDYSAAARFALGSGYARLAELTAAPDEARTHWTLAKQHFDLVRDRDLKDAADLPRLAFRSAKVRAAVGLPPGTTAAEARLLITVLGNVPFGEEPGEAGRLQADLALRLNPPDTHTAKNALDDYLKRTGIGTPPESLARAKLKLAQIHLVLDEADPARKLLEQVGADAPTEVLAPAKALLAQVRIKEKDWLGATRDLESVRALPGIPAALKLSVAYHLGYCKLKTDDEVTAARLFEEAVKGEGPEAVAAAVRLAALYLKVADPARHAAAATLLVSAVKDVADAKEFNKNPFFRVPDSQPQPVYELAIAELIKDGAFEQAVKVADSYAKVSAPGRDREKRAEVLAAWATALQKDGKDHKAKAAEAAAEYEAVAALQADIAKPDALRRAASLYRMAGDIEKAVATLQKTTQLPKLTEETVAAVWVELAETLAAANRPEDVVGAFNRAMIGSGEVPTATRYRLARHFAETRDPRLAGLARNLFEQIAKQEKVEQGEQEFHERALVELAHEHIRATQYAEADAWLRKQLGTYPTGPEASLGRLLLGVCLLQRATAMTPPPPAPPADAATAARAGAMRDESLKLFKQVVADAEAKLARDKKLGDRDAWLRMQAGLRVLQTYQQLHKPNDLLAEAAVMLERHRNSVEELIILSLVYHAFRQKGESGKALQTRDQMKEVFDRLPSTLWINPTGEYSRAYWEKTWFADK
jgi:hypothetical protein